MNKKALTHIMEAAMHKKSCRTALVACLVLGSMAVSAADAPKKADVKADKEAIAKEIVTREENKRDADRHFKNGVDNFTKGEYEKAVEAFLKAQDIVRNLPIANAQEKEAFLETIRLHISKSYHCWAEDLYTLAKQDAKVKKYDEAIAKCKDAMAMYPPCTDLMKSEIAKYEMEKRALEFKAETKTEAVLPDFEDNRNEIEIHIQKARAFYKIGRWAEVVEQCRQIYTLDPYNVAAIDLERRAYLKLKKVGKQRKDLTAEMSINEASWSLVPPVMVSSVDEDNKEEVGEPEVKQDPIRNLRTKLNSIKFSKLVFDQTPLDQVIQILRNRSKELDPTVDAKGNKTHEGVNFVLRFSDVKASEDGEESSEDDFGDEEESEESSESTDAAGMPTVTFYLGAEGDDDENEDAVADAITLEKVIDAICQSAGLHYRVEEYAVVIAPESVPLDDNMTEFFTIDKEIVDSLESAVGEGEEMTEDGSEKTPLMVYFERHGGIKFENGAKAVFDQRINKLIVTNTPEMLDKIAQVISNVATGEPQVQIQVKFMEIAQNDLEELGFEYFVSRPNTYNPSSLGGVEQIKFAENPLEPGVPMEGQTVTFDRDVYLYSSPTSGRKGGDGYSYTYTPDEKVPQGVVPAGSPITFDDMVDTKWYYAAAPGDRSNSRTRHSMTYGKNSPGMVRNASSDQIAYGMQNMQLPSVLSYDANGNPITGRSTVDDTVFNWSRVTSSGHEYQAKLHALDLADSADTLTCPRITTMAGEEATLKMVTTKIYPTEWEESSLDEADGTSVFTPSTPDVQRDSDGQVDEGIVLTVTPSIIDEEKYTLEMIMNPRILDFGGWVDYSYQIILDGEEWPNTLKMPIIQVRSVETTVVCYDRSTVVLGGIVKDKVSMVDDQYPILGDLPVIGRLFQSKGKGTQKTNLLIFLSATLVKPDGTFVRDEGSTGGLPTF